LLSTCEIREIPASHAPETLASIAEFIERCTELTAAAGRRLSLIHQYDPVRSLDKTAVYSLSGFFDPIVPCGRCVRGCGEIVRVNTGKRFCGMTITFWDRAPNSRRPSRNDRRQMIPIAP
jgi:hypothetical protein